MLLFGSWGWVWPSLWFKTD